MRLNFASLPDYNFCRIHSSIRCTPAMQSGFYSNLIGKSTDGAGEERSTLDSDFHTRVVMRTKLEDGKALKNLERLV
jgi:hypothetical protein